MKLNHLNLTITDVPAARGFLEKYFGLRCEHTSGNAFAVCPTMTALCLR